MRTKGNYLFMPVSIVCILIVSSLFTQIASAHPYNAAHSQNQQVQTYHSVTKGTIAPAASADLKRTPSTASSAASSPKHIDKGERHIPVLAKAAAAHSQVKATSTSLTKTGTILQNFNGVSSLDSAVTNFGAEFEPPDQGLCVGNGFVLEAVNSAFTIYHTDGSPVLGPLNVNVLFNEGLTEFTSDPRCYFDKSTHTWIAIILFISGSNTESRTDIAINHNGDPTTPWTVYHLDATDDGTNGTPVHAGCPCLGDQPLLGQDDENVYISTNEFPLIGAGFNGAQIYALSKSQLFNLSNKVNFVHFDNLTVGGAIAASVQPAIARRGDSAAGFFMNSLNPFDTFDNRIGTWALTDRENVGKGKIPMLSSIITTSEPYGNPPPAIQKGNDRTLDSGDDRMQQVEFINGSLWGALATNVTIPNDTAPRAGIAWFNIQPKVRQELINSANVVRQGYISSLGNYVLYPAIVAGPDDTAAIGFTFTGPNNFPSSAFTVKLEHHNSFGGIRIAADGTGFYNLGTRWGDYSWATLDPDQNRFWLANEYIPPVTSQTPDGIVNWGTRVVEVDGRS